MDADELLTHYRASLPSFYAWAARQCGTDRALAEDVVQESWLRAVRTWVASGVPSDPEAWLRTVALNLLRRQARRAPLRSLEQPSELPEREPEEPCERHSLLQAGLAELPQRDAELLRAHHLEGRALASLAQEQRASVRAIEGRLHRARARLRAWMGRRLQLDGDHA